MFHSFFIHLSVGRHLGCFHVLAFANNIAISNGVHVYCAILSSSGYTPRIRNSGSYGGFIPTFSRNLHNVFYSGCINLHSNQQCKTVPFLHNFPSILDDGHSDWYEMISHCSYDFHFSNAE